MFNVWGNSIRTPFIPFGIDLCGKTGNIIAKSRDISSQGSLYKKRDIMPHKELFLK